MVQYMLAGVICQLQSLASPGMDGKDCKPKRLPPITLDNPELCGPVF